MLKIHWNLKNPIKISLNESTPTTNSNSVNGNNGINNKQDNFKATSVKDLNEKKCWDDSTLKNSTVVDDTKNKFPRSQSVKCKPNKWKRTQLSNMIQHAESISENVEEEVEIIIKVLNLE